MPKANGPKPPAVARAILAVGNFAVDPGGKLFVYRNGAYLPRGEREVRSWLPGWLSDFWTRRFADEVIGFMRDSVPELSQRPPEGIVNVANGLLELETLQLLPHTPEYLSLVQIPVTYDHNAECPNIMNFVAEVFPEDAVAFASELPGVLLVPGLAQEKALLFLGPGGNGRSTYLKMIENFLGGQNVAAVPLHRLEADRFSSARLLGKLANICPDLPSDHLRSTAAFKGITGADTILGEHKFKESFEFQPFCRLVFSANTPPRSSDSSPAFFARWVTIPLAVPYRGTAKEIPRHVLDARLSCELSGLLNLALDGLERFRSNGDRYSIGESMPESFEEFRQVTDPIAIWLDRTTELIPDGVVAKGVLYGLYRRWAESQNQPVLTPRTFGVSLKELRPTIRESQRRLEDKRSEVWLGLELKSASLIDFV